MHGDPTRLMAARRGKPALSNEEIVKKWRLLIRNVIDDEQRRDRIENACLGIEEIDDVMALGDLLAGLTKNLVV